MTLILQNVIARRIIYNCNIISFILWSFPYKKMKTAKVSVPSNLVQILTAMIINLYI